MSDVRVFGFQGEKSSAEPSRGIGGYVTSSTPEQSAMTALFSAIRAALSVTHDAEFSDSAPASDRSSHGDE